MSERKTEEHNLVEDLQGTQEYEWLNEISAKTIAQSVKDACDAYKKMFKGLSRKPRFKSKKRSKPELTGESIGIDVGIKELAVCSNGMAFKNINKTVVVKKTEKRLRRLQRKVSRKYEMNREGNRFVKTSNIVKVEKSIRLLHRRLTNIRTNHIHQATNAIAKTKPSAVVMEDLNVRGMMKNRHLSKAIAGQKFHEFIRQMKYKCEKIGVKFIQRCSDFYNLLATVTDGSLYKTN